MRYVRVDIYSRHAICKLYAMRTALTAADLLNDRILPFYEAEGIPVLRILTDRGTEYCGHPERHEYQLSLALNDIDHTRTKTKSPQLDLTGTVTRRGPVRSDVSFHNLGLDIV